MLTTIGEILVIIDFRPPIMPKNHYPSNGHGRQRVVGLDTPHPGRTWEEPLPFEALGDWDNPIRIGRDVFELVEE